MYITMAKILNREASATEKQEFEAWLAADSQNRQTFSDLKGAWQEADVLLKTPSFDHNAAWSQMSSRMAATADTAPAAAPKKRIALPSWQKYMVAAAAVLIIGFISFFNIFSGAGNLEVYASNGNHELTLPDNSVITLKQGAKITYPRKFDEAERHVTLEGEAFFDVARNEKQPFTIDAGGATVQVLGTSFNVQSGKAVTVVVATGKVSVRSNAAENVAVILTPGEKGIVHEGQARKETVRSDNFLYWKTGEMIFSYKTLDEAVRELNSYGGVKVRLSESADETLKQQVINLKFRNQSPEDMLTELSLITNTKWTKKGDEYLLSPKE